MNKIIENIPQINQQLQHYKSSIDVLINQQNEYNNSIKRYSNKKFEYQTTENITEENKNEIETMMDQLEDINKRNDLMIDHIDEFLKKMNQMKETIEEMKKKYLNTKEFCETKMKQFGKIMVSYYREIEEKEMKKIKEKFFQLRNPYIKYIDEEENEKQLIGILERNEMKQLEQWTNKKCGEVVFDSNKDDWSQHTSVFDSRVMNKSNLMFVIEDTNNNKFGGYINSTIDKYESYINLRTVFGWFFE